MTEPILVLTDKQIFPDAETDYGTSYEERLAVKVVAFDGDGRLALIGTKYRLLPGGGVEEGETLKEAVWREAKEETGCDVKIEREVAITEEYRAKVGRHQITHYFIASVIGEKGQPTTTQADEQGIQVDWLSLDEAIAILEDEVRTISFKSYHACFNVRTQLAVLKKIKQERLT